VRWNNVAPMFMTRSREVIGEVPGLQSVASAIGTWLRRSASIGLDNSRSIRAPRGSALSAKSWLTEAPLRMLMNNLDAEVAEKPHELVVYGGIGRAARD
jgi:hypothetical protein